MFDNDNECTPDVARNKWVTENTLWASNQNPQDGLPDPRAICAEQITYCIESYPNLSHPSSCIVFLVAPVEIVRGGYSCRMYLESDQERRERA